MTKTNEYIEQIGPETFIGYLGGKNAAIIQLASAPGACENRTVTISHTDGAARVRAWGKNNDVPQIREQIVGDNNIVGALISTKRNIALGAGLQPYRERWDPDAGEGGKYIREPVEIWPEAAEFIEAVDLDAVLQCAARNYYLHGQYVAEIIRTRAG